MSRTTRTGLTVLVAAVALAAALEAQQQIQIVTTGPDGPVMQMGQGREFKTGTGRIRGRVVSAENGTPIRRAQVRIFGNSVAPKTAMTDGDGRYEFTDLPEGSFSLSATKSGYMNVQYGQTRPFESGRRIELADKQVLEKADIAMPRGGVISGRIVDEFGEPLADVMVTAMRQSWQAGRRRLMPAGRFSQTNDLGQYRMYGLAPGEYYVSATLRSEMPMFEMMDTGNVPSPGASMPTSGYAPTYFPGTPTAADAQRVTVAAGQESQSTDFALLPTRLAKITGVVINSEGRPVEGAMISAVPSRGLEGLPIMGGGGRTNKDGAFTLHNITPGDYTLQVRQMTVMTSSLGNEMTFTSRIGGPGGDQEFGIQPVSVSGEDLSNVVITTSKGGTASGHVTFEGTRPGNTNGVRVQAMSADMDGPMIGRGGMGSAIKPDGAFELKGMAGVRMIRVNGIPPGWSLKSVQLNGTDVTDTGIDFKGGESATGIDIVLSSKNTEINGAVTQSDGSPVKDYTVVVFAEDSQKWTIPMTRWVTGTRPDQDGRFKVQNLPAGSYYAIAVDYIPQGEWGDPDLLERLRARATHVTLNEGGTETVDLKIVDSY